MVFVRVLRSHVMVRVGGGWETLAAYFSRIDPCRAPMESFGKHGGGGGVTAGRARRFESNESLESPTRNQPVERMLLLISFGNFRCSAVFTIPSVQDQLNPRNWRRRRWRKMHPKSRWRRSPQWRLQYPPRHPSSRNVPPSTDALLPPVSERHPRPRDDLHPHKNSPLRGLYHHGTLRPVPDLPRDRPLSHDKRRLHF